MKNLLTFVLISILCLSCDHTVDTSGSQIGYITDLSSNSFKCNLIQGKLKNHHELMPIQFSYILTDENVGLHDTIINSLKKGYIVSLHFNQIKVIKYLESIDHEFIINGCEVLSR